MVKSIYKEEKDVEIYVAETMGQALELAVRYFINVFVVDICLSMKNKKDVSGLEFVEAIRKLPEYRCSPVIFLTYLEDPRLHTYEDLHCFRYIQKPYVMGQLLGILREALEYGVPWKQQKRLALQYDGVLHFFSVDDILCAFSKDSKLTVILEDREVDFFYMSCKELMEQLPKNLFQYCNRSTIVNVEKIEQIIQREGYIRLHAYEKQIKLSRKYRKSLLEAVKQR